jgi:hypothetical protein
VVGALEVSGRPQGEYTAFVHLEAGEIVTGFDRAPADGFSPSTEKAVS